MYKKEKTIFITVMFVISFFGNNIISASAALDNIEEGDTLYYNVSKYNVPLAEFLVAEDIGIDPAEITLDLAESKIGIKVMKKLSDGTYILNSFAILGKQIVIPVPDNAAQEVKDIFSDGFVLPAGVGLSIGYNIPGSNLVTLFDNDDFNDKSGLPIYIEPSKSSEFKNYINGQVLGEGVSVTVDDDTDIFKITVLAKNTEADLTLVAEWYKTGDFSGIFKGLDISGTIENSGGSDVAIEVAFTFERKEFIPLPDELLNKERQIYNLEEINFDLKFTGVFEDFVPSSTIDSIESVKDSINDVKGEDIIRVSIMDVQGLFYKINADFKDLDTNSWNTGLEDLWFNGFTGTPTYYNPDDPTQFSALSLLSIVAFTPLYAPAITPDWTVWQANTKTVSAIYNLLSSTFTSASANNEFIKFGISVDNFNTISEIRQSDQFRYFYNEIGLNISYDSSEALSVNRPSTFDGSERVNFGAVSKSWTSYTDKGLAAGLGSSLSMQIDATSIPINSSLRGDGSIKMNIEVKIRNTKFDTLPDGAEAAPLGGGGLSGINGFEFFPIFSVLFIAVIIRSKRKEY